VASNRPWSIFEEASRDKSLQSQNAGVEEICKEEEGACKCSATESITAVGSVLEETVYETSRKECKCWAYRFIKAGRSNH